jgi:hypothetical protein
VSSTVDVDPPVWPRGPGDKVVLAEAPEQGGFGGLAALIRYCVRGATRLSPGRMPGEKLVPKTLQLACQLGLPVGNFEPILQQNQCCEKKAQFLMREEVEVDLTLDQRCGVFAQPGRWPWHGLTGVQAFRVVGDGPVNGRP